MLKKILLDQERILLHDTLSYLIGPVKVPAALVITNHRLLILPNQNWSHSLGYAPRSLTWSEVSSFSLGYLNKNLQIHTPSEQFSLWGNAAKRTHDLLTHWKNSHISLDSSVALLQREQIAFSTETQVQAGIGLTVTGDLLIQQTGFKLSYKVLDQKEHLVRWTDLTQIEYKSLSQSLVISWGTHKVKLQGNQAQLLYQLIDIFNRDDIFVDGIWEGKWTNEQNTSSGFVFMGQHAMYLISCGMLSDGHIQEIPCANIQSLEIKGGDIVIKDTDDNSWIVDIDTPNIWVGYHTRILLSFWQAQNLSFTDRVVQDTCAYIHNDIEKVSVGRLVADTSYIAFYLNGSLDKVEFPSEEIIRLKKRASRMSLHHQVKPAVFEFSDREAVSTFAKYVEPQLSPMSVSFSRDNQPLEDILGDAKKLTVFMDGAPLVKIEHCIISDRNGVLHFRCNRITETIVIPKGVKVEVDIISPLGHYGFTGVVDENSLNVPDLAGRYGLRVQLLGSIKLINQRAAFRVPTDEQVDFTIFTTQGQTENLVGNLVDLSSGGCQILYSKKPPLDIELLHSVDTTLTTYIPITLIKENKRRENRRFGKVEKIETIIELPGKIRRATISEEDTKTLILGVEFTEATPKDEYRLLRKILALEREPLKDKDSPTQRR